MITKTQNLARKAANDAERCEVRLHFTNEELDEMEKRAREFSRMDWCDKLKLISQARHAIACEKFAQLLAARIIKAVGVLGDDDEGQINDDIKRMIGEIHECK